MLTAGHYYTLRVERVSDHGLYLSDDDGEQVLLPNRYVSKENRIGDSIDVFVYHDSEDRLIATTDQPLATVGEVAYLKVIDKTIHGAFLDWGLKAKDLFLPNRNQQGRLEIGRSTVVYLYTDNVTGRVVATNFLNGFIHNLDLHLKPKQKVDILVVSETPIGYRAVIDNRHWGMLYRNQLFQPIAIGDRLSAYVRRITEDRRVDLILQQSGYEEVQHAAERLLDMMRKTGGRLPLSDRSAPEEVYDLTHMSKKVFKRSMGYLMKQGLVVMEERETRLKK